MFPTFQHIILYIDWRYIVFEAILVYHFIYFIVILFGKHQVYDAENVETQYR